MKKTAYFKAYKLLSIAGSINNYIKTYYLENIDYFMADLIFNEIKDRLISLKKAKTSIRLTRAFCKNGTISVFPELQKDYTKISISGNRHSAYIIMNKIKDWLSDMGSIETLIPSPLSSADTDGIITYGSNISIVDGDAEFTSPEVLVTDEITILKEQENALLNLAKDALTEASSYHFKLEDIYTQAMDFSKNDYITEGVIFKIDELLS